VSEKKVFPGISGFVEAATTDPMFQNDARNCSSLQTAGDLLGQAYAAPLEAAAGILAEAEKHWNSLRVRTVAAGNAVAQARQDLGLAEKPAARGTASKKG
jgi:hypothetical protein